MRRWPALLIAGLLPAVLAPAAKDSCLECHWTLEGNLGAPAAVFRNDIHGHHGFSCASCHGGDPTQEDPQAAMNPARGYLGKIARTAVPKLCARCHGDASLIHKFRPQQRVDQLAQYQTSVHGKRLATGDTAVANCVDCHGAHDIREVKQPLSPVHPLRLPTTCARCHSNGTLMARYKLPATQFDDYRHSVHWEALAKRRDLSAPSCASCHGNHGATPPQVTSVAAVCGTCHALMEDLYQKSPHKPVFAATGIAGCVVCHGNHKVLRPSGEMLAGPNAVCNQCHDANSAGGLAGVEMARAMAELDAALERADRILARAARDGMEVSEAVLRQREGREALVKARVATHLAQLAAVTGPVKEGLAIAAETQRAGEAALRERDVRRLGLLFSLAAISITIAGLWVALRSIERRSPKAGMPSGGD